MFVNIDFFSRTKELKPSCLMGADRGARKMNHFTTEVA